MDNETSEITKLTERVTRDPKSKLFVPLAEEYKKMGDIEMSIHVLTEGLKNNPGYVTAKSFLGRLLMEKGDLAGAGKEFEEVVKAIPDNLLAQRKLGDIYALQGGSAQALLHYKVAHSLNPADEEISSFISDLEAGRTIKERILQPMPKPAAAEAAKGEKPGAVPQATPGAGGRSGGLSKPLTASTSSHASKGGDTEEPEEVLAVEPLESGASAERGAAGGFDFLAETHAEPAPADTEQSGDFIEIAGAPQSPAGMPVGAQAGARQTAGEADKGPSEQASQTSDDFTTNTLAELYIAQGFYEKAIDIYDRMLAENPASLPLQDKLARVRALAGPAAPANDLKTGSTPFVRAEVSSLSSQGPEPSSPFREEEVNRVVLPSPEAFSQAVSSDAGFKPGEYQAPGQASRSGEEAGARPVAAGKKETIDRLEQWLKNIMKEKQR
jgi:pentatricopeptide repeat protein